MDFEISNLNTLNHLQDRVVRGAKPGAYNSTGSGKVYVSTSSASASADVKDYLLQAAIAQNTKTGRALFTVGSKVVSTEDSFAGIEVGDSFRKEGEHLTYSVESIESLQSLTLNRTFRLDEIAANGTQVPGTYRSVKVVFGNLHYDSVENTESNPNSFSYLNNTGRWVESPGVAHQGPYDSGTTTFKDGIELNFVGRNNPPTPDLQGVGSVLERVISVPSADPAHRLSLPVVPYPDDLSTLRVEELLQSGTGYQTLDTETQCFVDYTGNPFPTTDQPPFGLRNQSWLFRTEQTFAYTEINPQYSGQWAIKNNEGRITAILLGSEEVSIGDANNPPFIIEDHVVTQEDIDSYGFQLQYTPVSKVAVNVQESSAQSEGLDFRIAGNFLSWRDLALEAEIFPGIVVRCMYQASGESILLYLYKDYLLEPISGLITTIKAITGSVFTMQYIKLTAADVSNKYVLLGAAPTGSVALNVSGGPAQSIGVDFRIEGNRLAWDDMRLDAPEMSVGTVLRVMYQSGSGEDPVKYMMRDVNLFNCGIQAFKKTGDFSSIDLDDSSTWGSELKLGRDFFVNEANGGLRIEKTLSESEMVFFVYYGKGSDVTDTLDPEVAPAGVISDALRVSTYPLIPYTINIKVVGPQGTRTYLENRDFVIATDTGVINLITPTYKGDKLYVSYVSAAPAYYGVMAGQGLYSMRAYEEPCRAVSNKSIKLYNKVSAASKKLDLSTLIVKTVDGVSIPVKDPKYDPSSGTIVFQENSNVVKDQLYIVDYEFSGKSLPFAPLMRLSKYARKGQNWISTDGFVDQDTISAGQVLAIAPYDTTAYKYYRIKSILNSSGENRRLVLNRSFSSEVLEPQTKLSDVAIDFIPFSELSVAPYVAGVTSIVIEGDLSKEFGIGRMFMVEDSSPNTKSEIYRITSSVYNGSTTTVNFEPPAETSETRTSVLSAIKVSQGVVYQEGDTALITDYPVYPGYHPLWKVEYTPTDGYATIRVNEDKVILEETNSQGTFTYEVPVESGYRVDDVAEGIEAAGGGNKFQVTWLFPKGSGTFQDNMEKSQAEIRLPYIVNCRAQVMRKAEGESVYTLLKAGAALGDGDYHITGNYVYIEEPLKFGDKFIISYLGIDNLAIYRGRSLQVLSKNLIKMPGRANYKVSYDYYKPDQLYIQTMAEKDYLDNVVAPYLEQAEASREGQGPMGSDGVPSVTDPVPSDGGLVDSFFSLRDEALKLGLYKKAYKYYADRMSFFALEYEAISALRIANCEFSAGMSDPRYNLINFSDIDNYATFGVSDFSPIGNDSPDPKMDGRFTGSYLSYGEANFFNHGGKGIMISANAEFKVRGLVAGDYIRIDGKDKEYEIAQVVSEEEIRFTELIEGKQSNSGYEYNSGKYQQRIAPIFSWLGSVQLRDVPKKGYKYWVRKDQIPAVPFVDSEGCPDAVAKSSKVEPYALSEDYSYSNYLVVQVSTDAGSTWTDYEINLSFLEEPFTASKVANAIRRGVTVYNPSKAGESQTVLGFSDVFKVTAERLYVSEGVDTATTLDTAWPLELPRKYDLSGTGYGIVFRANSRSTWFRFAEPKVASQNVYKTGATTLGFPVGVIFKGNLNTSSAYSKATQEKIDRNSESSKLSTIIGSYSKMSRGLSDLYVQPLTTAVNASKASANAMKSSVQAALTAVNSIIIETDATDAIAQTYGESLAMKTKYTTQISDITSAVSADTSFVSSITADPYGFTSTLTSHTKTAASARSETSSSYATGVPTIQLTSPGTLSDPRIAWGDRTKGFSFAGKKIFPTYVQGSLPVGQKEAHPQAVWGDTAASGEGVLQISVKSSDAQSTTVTVTETYIEVTYVTMSLSTSIPPVSIPNTHKIKVLFSEKKTVQEVAAAITSAGAGYIAALVVAGTKTTLSSQEKLYYGSVPSVDLDKVSGVACPAILKTHLKWYSQGSTATLQMTAACTITPTAGVLSPTMYINATGISLYSASLPGGVIHVPYAGKITTGEYMTALVSAVGPYFNVTWDNDNSSYKYGSFVPAAGKSLPNSVYFDVKGDIRYYTVSDDNLVDRLAVVSERVSDLTTALADYTARKPQIETSVSTDGEDLYSNMYMWLKYIADKEAGPCVMIPPMKKRLLNSKLLKEMTT